MDVLVNALIGAAPQLGVAGVLLVVLGLVLRREAQDRNDYRASLAATNERHAAEIKRINDAHDEELAELKADIKELRSQLDQVNTELDKERAARRRAEDSAMQQLDSRREGGPPWHG